jgi:outer membrane protein assembly factor BamE (lipoprotein component of BamABCDE complex)
MKVRYGSLVILMLSLCVACSHTQTRGNESLDTVADTIKIGSTTKAEVLKALGEPANKMVGMQGPGTEMWSYSYFRQDTKGAPGLYDLFIPGESHTAMKFLTIAFKNGKVSDCTIRTSKADAHGTSMERAMDQGATVTKKCGQ